MIRQILHADLYMATQPLKNLLLTICILAFVYSPGKAQLESAEAIRTQFEQLQSQSFKEKIFVHTDKTIYLAGELIWFKVYNTDGYLNMPVSLSKITYVEILSADNKSVLQGKIAMNSGTGSGSFLIPPSLSSGNYRLRAYTNWMRNFPADNYFEKQITIVNSFKRPEWKIATEAGYDFQLFPEGGNLVAGLETNVAFRLTDQYGNGVQCAGIITNQRNDTVAVIKSLRLGMGRFRFLPKAGETYKARVLVRDTFLVKEFPPVYNKGYVMNVTDAGTDQLRVIVHTNDNAPSLPVYLLIHKKQVVRAAIMNLVQNGSTTFLVKKSDLPDGISNFLLFDRSRQPVSERLYFKKPGKKLQVDIRPDKQEYGTKEKVTIDLNSHNDTIHSLQADMSISVFLLDSLQHLDPNDIHTYLWLTSELKGRVESPSYYFTNDGPETSEATDNLMLTHGWRRFEWNDSVATQPPALNFLPEYEGHIVRGKLVDKQTGRPKSDVSAFLSITGVRFQYSNAISDQDGDVRFLVKDFFGTEELIVQTNSKADTGYRIDISSPFSEQTSSSILMPFALAEDSKNALVIRSLGAQTQNLYLADSIRQFFSPPFTDTTAFYGTPDKEYLLDDYTRFITMEEVMREFVSEVRLKKQQNAFDFSVVNQPYKLFFEQSPLVLLDGVPIFDVGRIISFDPLKIKKIDVVTQRYYHGKMVNHGIVSYKTYQGDLAGFQLDPAALVVEYEGLQLKRQFYSPIYDNPNNRNRLPDFRNVLYWSPDVATDSNGKAQLTFYSSEIPGTYAVVLCGITRDGYAGSSVSTFSIRTPTTP